jgi:hypothetical protein
VYERPFALLFLPAPPDEASLDVQFRRLRDASPSLGGTAAIVAETAITMMTPAAFTV